MRFPVVQAVSAFLQVAVSLSAPIDDAASDSTAGNTSMLPVVTADVPEYQCPRSHSCGAVTYHGNQYTGFGTGICMSLGAGIQSIYVSRCYCTLWSVCTGNSDTDVYLGSMAMCPRPAVLADFSFPPKFISCGGLNAPGK